MSKILKDAMIDAKAVRATALANARAALEEAFSPKLEAMFSQKLKEMDQEGQPESIDSIQPEDQNIGGEEIPTDFDIQDTANVNPVADISSGEDIDQTPHALAESEETSYALDSSKSGGKTTDSVGVNGQTKQALKKDDKNVTANFSGKAQGEPAKAQSGEKTTDSVGVNGQTKQAAKADDKNFTSPLKENECEEEKSEKSELEEILSELECGSKEEEEGKELDESDNPFAKKEDGEEEIDLDEVLSSLKEESEEEEEEEESKENDELKEKNESLVKENTDYKRALSYLKTKLNEINLLNAKLLYTNKLFKAADLSNNQKVKIVENMDLAKTVREVKYAYAIIAESINFGGKQPIKESAAPKKAVVQNKVVSTITEGLASKAVASTKPSKELLTEGAVMANRFQKLAGIKTGKA